jgi:ribosome biogenesis SPOUT family RNA methylase Rps3
MILGIRISIERTIMLVAEQFIQSLVRRYGKQNISTDGGIWYPLQACKFLKIENIINIIYIHLMGKASLSVQSSTLKIELNVLMTIFLVEKRDAN